MRGLLFKFKCLKVRKFESSMKFIDEFRDAGAAKKLTDKIRETVKSPCNIMEVCGGQTHSIMKYGLDKLLPEEITLLHGPGCPVCVTGISIIDKAVEIALRPEVILCSFGDMLRVPGSRIDLLSAKAAGGDVRMVYSPTDAVKMADENRDKEIVFFAVGFETTAPANGLAVLQAEAMDPNNFSLLSSQVLVPPALELLMNLEDTKIDGFLAPGHVCTITGYEDYERISSKYRVPIAVTGFEPVDILAGVYSCVKMLAEGRYETENCYGRVVRREGNLQARQLLEKVFTVVDREWRGIGVIPGSGLNLNAEYARFDALNKFGPLEKKDSGISVCISGEILQGKRKPPECPVFGKECTPMKPLGATMVSSEGACAAYYKYGSKV